MQPRHLKLASFLLAVTIALTVPSAALAETGDDVDTVALSPYWSQAVRRWEPIIVRYATQWKMDPDFVAAVVWKESLGRPNTQSPAGAVGLMGLMPFPWRPSPEELENPWTNVFWGSRALAQTIGDGKGDLYYSLAAYNGSWKKAGQDNTRRYAANVLDSYTRAVAVHHGLPPDGDWIAILTVEGMVGPGTLTVFGPQRALARYTERPFQVGIPAVPTGVPPHATVITFTNGRDHECQVNLWLVSADGSALLPPAPPAVAAPNAGDGATAQGMQGQGPELHPW